jgi:membrane protease YdiL (CAAX protease family)
MPHVGAVPGRARDFCGLASGTPRRDIPAMPEIVPAPDSRRDWLRPELLSSWSEFLLVSALLIVLPIRSSTLAAFHGSSKQFLLLLLDDRHMLWSIFCESLVLAGFLYYLHKRGWRPADFKIGLGWLTSAQGIILLGIAWLCSIAAVVTLLTGAFYLQTAHPTFPAFVMANSPSLGSGTPHLHWALMFVAMVVNAFAEELVFMGYIFNQIAARRGPVVALVVTVFLRLACHTYQDPMHLAGIGVLFTFFALAYWNLRKLWPLIFAHLLLDTLSFTLVLVLMALRQHLGVALVYFGQQF